MSKWAWKKPSSPSIIYRSQITKENKIMYTPKPVNFSIVRQKKDNYNWYSVAMEHNGNYYILKEYSKSKARALEYIRKIRTGSYKSIPTQTLENV